MPIKNIVTISLIIFIIVIIGILGVSVFLNQNKASAPTTNQQNTSFSSSGGTSTNTDEDSNPNDEADEDSAGNKITAVPTNPSTSTITATQVAKHNNANDCWTIVNGKVYNVTNLIATHTGGADKIIAGCGKDSSVSFNTKGGKGSHSERAQAALNTYYVGDLSR